jgi:DNA-binding CsgD family transcriptional regulator
MPPVDSVEYTLTVSLVRSLLDEPRFALAHDAGVLLNPEQALAVGRLVAYMPMLVAQVPSQGEIAPPAESLPAKVGQKERLSDRELEVLRLVAGGLTNAEVAAELILSTHTVRAHLYSIFSKFDVSSRTAAVRFATERGLV